MPVGAIAGAALAVGVGSTVASMSASSKAAKQNRKASRYERQKANLQSARQKMEVMRAGRQAAAQVLQNAENQGMSGSSIGQGGAGSIVSQTGGNLSFLDRYGYYSDQASKHLQKAADYNANAQQWGAVADLGFKVFGAVGGTGAFKGPPPPKPK